MSLTPARARRAAAAALALPILLLALRFAGGSRSLYGQDFQMYYRAHAEFAREALRRDRELPRWNPYQYAGVPFLGNSQGNFYYPGNWLFLAMAPEPAFEGLVVLHLLLAAFGLYRLTRYLGLSRPACVLAAVAYSISFPVVMRIYAGHLPYFITICQAPLLLLLLLKAVDRPTLLHAAGLGAMIAMVLFGGNPQFLYHLALLCAATAAWRIVSRPAGPRAILAVAGGGALGLALASIQLLPSIEVAAWSSRGGDPAQLARLSEPYHHFGLAQLLGFWVPHFRWTPAAEPPYPHEKALYLGILPLLLAIYRVASDRFRGPALFFGLVAALALLDAFGRSFIVHPVLSLLPGFAKFRIPERVVWVAGLCLCVLSAYGWDSATRAAAPRIRTLAGLGVLAAGAAAVMLITVRAFEAFAVIALGAASIAAIRFAPRGPAVAAAAVALTALDLLGYGVSRVHSVPPDRYNAPPWYAASIGPERRDGRILDLTTIDAAPVAHGFRLLRGCGYPVPPAVAAYYGSGWKESRPNLESLPDVAGTVDPAVLRRLNVRWAVTRGEPPAADWKKIAQLESRSLYEDPQPGRAALLEGTNGLVVTRRPTASSISVHAVCTAPGRLVVSEAWTGGWKAQRNGHPIPVVTAEGGLLAVDLPDGESRLTFDYAPAAWTAGRILSGVGLVALAALLCLELRRRGKRQEAPSSVR